MQLFKEHSLRYRNSNPCPRRQILLIQKITHFSLFVFRANICPWVSRLNLICVGCSWQKPCIFILKFNARIFGDLFHFDLFIVRLHHITLVYQSPCFFIVNVVLPGPLVWEKTAFFTLARTAKKSWKARWVNLLVQKFSVISSENAHFHSCAFVQEALHDSVEGWEKHGSVDDVASAHRLRVVLLADRGANLKHIHTLASHQFANAAIREVEDLTRGLYRSLKLQREGWVDVVLEPLALVDNVLRKLFALKILEDAVQVGNAWSLYLKRTSLPVVHVRPVWVQFHEKLFVFEDPLFVDSIDVIFHSPSGKFDQHFFDFF